MKIFAFSLTGIALSFSGIVKAKSDCADKIDTAQKCVKQCLSIASLNLDSKGAAYGNLLLECIDQTVSSDVANQIGQCCGMESYEDTTCEMALQEADSCLKGELSNVGTTTEDYLQCIYDKSLDGSCPFASFCVAILVGGYNMNQSNDFAVGSESNLAEMTSNAETCDDMNIFGKNACENVEGCCGECANKIAGVVNAVIDDLLLPAYGNSNLQNCGGNKSCDNYTTTAIPLERKAEESIAGSTMINAMNSPDTAGLAEECIDGLASDIVLYNETFAVTNLFGCISRKMGDIVVETVAAEIESIDSSSTTLFFGATASALSILASAFYAIVP